VARSSSVEGARESYRVVEMDVAHIPQVLEIERRSFPTPWSERAFLSELTQNAYAHYIVVLTGVRVVGYAGMWLILDEAHVTNIAVHPDFRGRHLGDRLLVELQKRALAHGCTRMTLEVRPSNPVAQHLYRKHGFEPRGLRPGYYTDTREDAIIMWKDGLDAGNPHEIKPDGE
jgi:ribosomal-protein-alanine N-acetyltransferase